MGELIYLEALRRGRKEQRKCLQKGRSPYLPVLDEILTQQNILTEIFTDIYVLISLLIFLTTSFSLRLMKRVHHSGFAR